MPKQKLSDDKPGTKSTADLVLRLNKFYDKDQVETAGTASKAFKYLDFINTKTGTPWLSLEWLFGSRGMAAGRVTQLIAGFSKGKSSLMYALYGMFQRTANIFAAHGETEGAGSPADYIARFGCNPEELIQPSLLSLEQAIEFIDTLVATVRGGFGGELGANGKLKNTRFNDPLDAEQERPVMIGIDSLSSLGAGTGVDEDIADITKSDALGLHSRRIRDYLRKRVTRFRQKDISLILTSHETAKINMGLGGYGSQQTSSLAGEAIGIHATYVFKIKRSEWKHEGAVIGHLVNLKADKNKVAGTDNKNLDLYLVADQGFDPIKTDYEFLSKAKFSPVKGQITAAGRWVKFPAISDKPFGSPEELMMALYQNQDYLMSLREQMRIRGFGFDFENNWANEPEYPGPETQEAQEAQE
jgi:RecA/RadA recombinase